MNSEKSKALEVILSLRSFTDKIAVISNLIEGKNRVSHDEKLHLQGLLKELKGSLSQCSKYGTTDGEKRLLTQYEDLYFCHAVSSASAHLTIKTNSHPIKSRWSACLYNVDIDITHVLFQLQEKFPDV